MRALALSPVVETALVVAILALGRPVFVPVTLAFYLAFILTPPSERLERLGLPRGVAIASITGAAFSALGVVGVVLVSQAAELAGQMRTYAVQMSAKLSSLHSAQRGVVQDLVNAVSELGRILDSETVKLEDTTPVRVVSGGLSGFERLEQAVGPLLGPVALSVVIVVMAIFVIGKREDLRGRLIRLVGTQNVTVTTRTMVEAVNRVSHFLLTQACINAGFGTAIAVGLYFIGVPYALLWGALAALLRFVPLLGSAVATLLPTLAAFAIFPGWYHALFTLGFFFALDLLTANLVEPVVLGKRAGVSPLGLLISALFWAWLWGPVGLVLATPLTVCAAVVGRHVPRLAFLTTLLGDEPGLRPSVEFYQRILAKATRDAQRLAKSQVTETSLGETLEELVVPALGLMLLDQNQQTIGPSAAARVVKDMSDIVSRLSATTTASAPPVHSRKIVAIPAESDADQLLLELLALTLAGHAPLVRLAHASRANSVAAAIEEQPDVVCIAAYPPSGSANARYLCRRLRAALPDARLLVLAPDAVNSRSKEAAARFREAGANDVVYGLREASELLLAAKPETAAKSARAPQPAIA
ncbi:MAG TPA: AI-2E family transporter [Polyangiaceae bacterium]|nr:AI-2E family transporter [Polyangiaceae bacterium]